MKNIFIIPVIVLVFSGTIFSQTGYGSGISAALAKPTGPNSEFFNMGYGAIGEFYYEMESGWRVGLTLGFIRTGLDNAELNNYFQTTGQDGILDIDGAVSTIPILLSGKYIFPGASTRFYGLIEGGLYSYWYKAEGTVTSSAGPAPIDKSQFSSEVGFALGFGVLFPVNKEVSIDANVRYHFVKNSGTVEVDYYSGEQSVGSSHFLTLSVGANWNFSM